MNHKSTAINLVVTILVGVTLILTSINPTTAYASASPEKVTPPTKTPEPTATIEATPMPLPTETPVSYEPALSLQSDPTYIVPGGQVTFLYQISNLEKFTDATILRFHIPFGFKPLNPDEGKYDETAGIFEIIPSAPEGKIIWQADENVVAPVGIYAELIQDDATIAETKLELTAPVEYKIETTGGTAESADGEVQVNFPSGAVSETVTVKVTEPSYEALPIQSLSGSPFEITAVSDSSKAEVTHFEQPVEIKITYNEGEIQNDEEHLRVFWYDPTDGQWKPVRGQWVDTEANVIHVFTDHFTVFDTYNSNWQSAETPTMSYFQTSSFTGSSAYSMPIKVPAGPGGFQPSLGLSYSSSTVDNSTTDTQASWVGMGWNLNVSYIMRNGHGTDGIQDDSYSLNLNGTSMELWKGADGKYHGSDENFYRFEYDQPADKWTVWDKSGNVYTFDLRAQKANIITVDCDPAWDFYVAGVDIGEPTTWRWSLSTARSIFGQELTYTYTKDTHAEYYYDCNNNLSSVQTDDYVYPSTITYSNGRYRIYFDPITSSEPNHRLDYKTVWGSLAKIHQTKLLEAVYVLQDADGDGDFSNATVIRKYQFNYCQNASCNIWPDHIWEAGGRTPTLNSVQEFGLGGTNSLPATNFYYEDNMHLTSASNGYGGTITYTYNDTNHNGILDAGEGPWGESIPVGVNGGYPVINSNKTEGWSRRTTGVCIQSEPTDVLRFYCEVKHSVKSGGDKTVMPGHHYTVIAEVKADRVGTRWGTWAKVGLVYKVGGAWQADQYSPSYTLPVGPPPNFNTPTVNIIFDVVVPGDATEVLAVMNSDGARLVSYKLIPVTTAYRVSSQTISTGSDSLTFKYDYTGAATNRPSNSEAAAGSHPYIKPYTEFRGHAAVTVTSPFGGQTITNYQQNDCYTGMPSAVTTKDAQGVIAQESASSYACTEWNSTTTLIDQDPSDPFLFHQPFNPIKYRWVRTTSATQTINGTVGGSLTTAYTYDSASGNLLTQSISGTNIPSLTTHYEYYTNPGGEYHLLSLPTRVWVTNAGGTIAESRNQFGVYVDSNNVSHDGILLNARALMRPGDYSQMSYGYDDWGNVISATTWTGYGSASSDPTAGAQTATTTYDPVYHTYPLTITNALGHTATIDYSAIAVPGTGYTGYTIGAPVSAYGPNGTATTVSAEYDSFGRLVKLIRPGDDSASPTLQIAYSTSPFATTLTQKIDNGQSYTVTRQYDGLGRPTSATAGGVTTTYQYGYANISGQLHRYDSASMPGDTQNFATTIYDSLGRVWTMTAPDGSVTTYAYDGLETTVMDANSNSTSTTSDILGRTIFVDAPIGPDITFGYDDLGNLTSALRGGAETTMQYDFGGRKKSMADPDMGAWVYDYDALSNLITQTDARGCTLTMNYDILNRLDTKASSGNCGQHVSVDYDYDEGTYGKGFRTSMEEASGSASWTYDERGRLTSENKTITGASFLTQWTYNSADMPVSMIYPDGETVTNQYNSNMQLTNVAGAETYASSFVYDSINRLKGLTIGSTLGQRYYYKDWNVQGGGRLDMTVTGTGAYNDTSKTFANLLLKNTYSYDSVGNITNIVSVSDSWSETQAFEYDELYRLSTASATGGQANYNEVYQYDSSTGNLVDKNGLILNYPAANGTRPHAVTSAGSNTYGYDANGNQTTRTVAGQTATLSYDAENRLVSATGTNLSATFTYDGDGRRVKSVVNSETILFAGGHYELNDTTDEVTKYYFAGASRIAVRKYTVPQSSTLTYLAGDHLGSTSLAVDASTGDVTETRYKPWGEVRYTTPSKTLPTRYTFTGQYSYIDDSATDLGAAGFGLMFYNARWYDPTLGRFAQADSIVPGGIQGLDRYAYVSNNPIIYTDPTGHVNQATCNNMKNYMCETHTDTPQFAQNSHGMCDGAGIGGSCDQASAEELKAVVTSIFGWTFAPGAWTYDRISRVFDYGIQMAHAIGKITGLDGVQWIRKYIGNAVLYVGPFTEWFLDKANAGGMVPWKVGVRLPTNFDAYTLFHELGHVLDNNLASGILPATYVGGGPADRMVRFAGGHPESCFPRFMCLDENGEAHSKDWYVLNVAGSDPWGASDYGNNSVADDFADAFAKTLLFGYVPRTRSVWMQVWLKNPI